MIHVLTEVLDVLVKLSFSIQTEINFIPHVSQIALQFIVRHKLVE